MLNILLVGAGGAVGSVCRYLVNQLALRLLGPGLPWGTFVVNVIGSLAIGILAEVIARKIGATMHMRLLLATGFLGGFTTFSAFSLEVSLMIERGEFLPAGLYILASVTISVAAVFAGLALARQFV